MKVVVLCGGKGTRAYPHTLDYPKPLMKVGNEPILRHVMEIYARQGLTEFVLAAGFKAELIEEFAAKLPPQWSVDVVETGPETGTGGRVWGCRQALATRGTFMVTYGDGVGSIEMADLEDFHGEHGRSATVTAVPLPSPYGTIRWEEGTRVGRFEEKPRLEDHWINAGFFVFEEEALAVFEEADDLEREVLPDLASEGELFAYRHHGFWASMDTYKDALELTALCRGGEGPWLRIGTRGGGSSSRGHRGSSALT